MDLAGGKSGKAALSRAEAVEAGLSLSRSSDEQMIDAQARAEYKRRIAELEQEAEAAEARNDGEMAAKARQEMDALVGALATANGLRGAPLRTPDHIERGRKAVTRRIRDALHRSNERTQHSDVI